MAGPGRTWVATSCISPTCRMFSKRLRTRKARTILRKLLSGDGSITRQISRIGTAFCSCWFTRLVGGNLDSV